MEKQMGYVQCKINKKALQPISSNVWGFAKYRTVPNNAQVLPNDADDIP